MSGSSMEVDTAFLHAGADRCGDGAAAALTAAGRLTAKAPLDGMFGDFAEAHAFHQLLDAAHGAHVEALHGHHRALTTLGDNGRSAAHAFATQDGAAAESVRAAGAALDAG